MALSGGGLTNMDNHRLHPHHTTHQCHVQLKGRRDTQMKEVILNRVDARRFHIHGIQNQAKVIYGAIVFFMIVPD